MTIIAIRKDCFVGSHDDDDDDNDDASSCCENENDCD